MYETGDGGVEFGDIIDVVDKKRIKPVPQRTSGVEEDAVTDEGFNHNNMDELFLGKPRKVQTTSETAMVAASDLEKQSNLLIGKTARVKQRTQLLDQSNSPDKTYILAESMHITNGAIV